MYLTDRRAQVSRLARAIAQAPDTRALKRELRAGNPYAEAFLARRGLIYRDGAIVAKGGSDHARTL